MLRLAKGTHLMGLAGLPAALAAGPPPGRPPRARARARCTADTFILQREARGGPRWLTTTGLRRPGAIVVAVWLALLAWALGLAEPRRERPPARYRGIDMATARRARLSTDARREQLVALGVEIFSERPFDEVSIDDIAASAGISKGLLYHYFPSKRDFYVAVVRHSADEMQARHRDRPRPRAARAPVDRPGQATSSTSTPTRAATRPCCAPASAPTARSRPSSRTSAPRWPTRILDDLPGGEPSPGVRIAVRGWVGFAEAASLEWLERRELSRDELRDLLIQALTGAIGAAASHYRRCAPCPLERRVIEPEAQKLDARRWASGNAPVAPRRGTPLATLRRCPAAEHANAGASTAPTYIRTPCPKRS